MVALEVATPRTLIVVFTDNGSKDLFLEDEIIKLRERKQCEVCMLHYYLVSSIQYLHYHHI